MKSASSFKSKPRTIWLLLLFLSLQVLFPAPPSSLVGNDWGIGEICSSADKSSPSKDKLPQDKCIHCIFCQSLLTHVIAIPGLLFKLGILIKREDIYSDFSTRFTPGYFRLWGNASPQAPPSF